MSITNIIVSLTKLIYSMMKQFILYLIATLCYIPLYTSCNLHDDTAAEHLSECVVIDSLTLEENFTYRDDTTTICQTKTHLSYPKAYISDKDLEQLNTLLSQLLFEDIYEQGCDIIAIADSANMRIGREMTQNRLPDEETESALNTPIHYNTTHIKPIYNDRNFLVYCKYNESYTGGAHGIYGSNYYVIYLPEMRVITVNDIFHIEDSDNIALHLTEQLLKDKNATNQEELYSIGYFDAEDILPTDNFYINNNGITWVYNPYEIGCYAIGDTHITLSFDVISHYLPLNSPIRTFIK